MPEQELEVRVVFQEDEQNPRELPLLALQAVGVAGQIGNAIEIEARQNAFVLAAIRLVRIAMVWLAAQVCALDPSP